MNFTDIALPDGWIAGLDVSAAQGPIPVPALLAAGVSFLWIRLTDGLHDVDRCARTSAVDCLAHGLPFGLYGVIEPYGEAQAEAQARHFLAEADGLGGALPPALDFELGKGRGAVDLLASACRWMDVVHEALGRSPILYAGPAFLRRLEQLGGAAAGPLAARLAQRPVWLADYGLLHTTPAQNLARGGPRVPPPWTDWQVWQVSGDGGITLPGGHGVVADLDVFRGTVAELLALGFDATATLPTGTPVVDQG